MRRCPYLTCVAALAWFGIHTVAAQVATIPDAWCRAVPTQGVVRAVYEGDNGAEVSSAFNYTTGDWYWQSQSQTYAYFKNTGGWYMETAKGALSAAPWMKEDGGLLVWNAFPLVLVRYLCTHPTMIDAVTTSDGVTRVEFRAPRLGAPTEFLQWTLEADIELSFLRVFDVTENRLRGEYRNFESSSGSGLVTRESMEGMKLREWMAGDDADTKWSKEGLVAAAGDLTARQVQRVARLQSKGVSGLDEALPDSKGVRAGSSAKAGGATAWPFVGAGVCLIVIGGWAWWRRRTAST